LALLQCTFTSLFSQPPPLTRRPPPASSPIVAKKFSIKHNFGSNVARMVEGLSDSLSEDPGNKKPWLERKQTYIQRLREEPADVQLISVADKLYNARAILEDYREIGPRVWERFKRGRNDQIGYFDELIKVYKSARMNRIVVELERVINELKQISAEEAH
jgi:(p)ppGpp synthase/HD superfamily hydrolase